MGQPLKAPAETKACHSGFTLLEIVLALGLTTLILLAVFYVMIGSLQSFQRAEEVSVVRALAREEIERVKERNVPLVAGLFDGSVPTPQLDGFPPPPYPVSADGYTVVVNSVAMDERLFSLVVEIYEGKQRLTSLETVVKK